MRRDDALIDDICDAGTAAVSYVENMTEEMFRADRRTQKAVISEILVMGEAVKRLSS